ncbi:MAG: LptA/OstA family protein [Cyanobacteria bacterium P01_A01_bin.105]
MAALLTHLTRRLRLGSSSLGLPLLLTGLLSLATTAPGEAQSGNAITLRADVQEANAGTGIVTARGNVRIDYPAREISATSAQAQYYSQERRIVLTGNVFIQQEGNTIRAETATYLIDEERFVATPGGNRQVESTYILPAAETPSAQATPTRQPEPLPPLPTADPIPTELPNLPPIEPSTQPPVEPSPAPDRP